MILWVGKKKKVFVLLAEVGKNIACGAAATEIGQNYKWHRYRSCRDDFLIEKCVFPSRGNSVDGFPAAEWATCSHHRQAPCLTAAWRRPNRTKYSIQVIYRYINFLTKWFHILGSLRQSENKVPLERRSPFLTQSHNSSCHIRSTWNLRSLDSSPKSIPKENICIFSDIILQNPGGTTHTHTHTENTFIMKLHWLQRDFSSLSRTQSKSQSVWEVK